MGNNLKANENSEEKKLEEKSSSNKDISQEKLNELKSRVDVLEKRLLNNLLIFWITSLYIISNFISK